MENQHIPEEYKSRLEELDRQIVRERLEIENAPKIPIAQLSGKAGRCHWCGRISASLVPVETVHGVTRYKGVDCCGARHI